MTTLITVETMTFLEEEKQWAKTTVTCYKKFLGLDTSIYWIIDFINDFCLNIPQIVHNVYVTNITKCFEIIPKNRQDTLFEVMNS